jgi:hypothetical protein
MLKLVNLSTTPLELGLSDIQMMGLQAWKALVVAYDRSHMTRSYFYISHDIKYPEVLGITRWPTDGSGWNEIASMFKVRVHHDNRQIAIALIRAC